ncbi:GNAT family N-acetyltransferase [Amycolatopsis sp. H20-H5]|uniref:GNAT family N-acetyltransferase n=1 Tax=Amycolatopsis sp. H20-H5 TaxID=3046309 RepID=UPI002DB94A89|nr:GNAT family N-acetyltransferase [Amycolatopsis sp. H20-H5]MEC3981597.1 GNAT family N-acetyltransferase [Amycolatopsis sp. H20-H5]
MGDFEVRAARKEELTAIGAVTLEAYAADGYTRPTYGDDLFDRLSDAARRWERAELIVAVDTSGAVLGSVTVARPGTEFAEIARDGELEFRMLSVAPAARGRGVGAALTSAVLERAAELGAQRVVMSSHDRMKTAHRLYERLGFTRLPDRDWQPEPGIHLLVYSFNR